MFFLFCPFYYFSNDLLIQYNKINDINKLFYIICLGKANEYNFCFSSHGEKDYQFSFPTQIEFKILSSKYFCQTSGASRFHFQKIF